VVAGSALIALEAFYQQQFHCVNHLQAAALLDGHPNADILF
jgi:hypothetical protein